MTLKDRLINAKKEGKKVIVPIKEGNTQIDILLTEKYIIVYSHRRGSHWNLGGSHWYYMHDMNGNYMDCFQGGNFGKVLEKQKLLKADTIEINDQQPI